jgi:3-oxosteroid 1-dehydrogenase
MIEAIMRLGAATALMDEAFWLPSSYMPDGTFVSFHVPNDTGKPHCIVRGRARPTLSSTNPDAYMEIRDRQCTGVAIPAWADFR